MEVALLGTRGIPARYGGTETYVELLSEYLAGQGDKVWVYGSRGASDGVKHAYAEAINRVEVPSIPTKHLDNLTRTLFSTLHVCFNRNVELVQYNNIGPCVFAILPRLFGKKVVGAVRALDAERDKWSWLASMLLHLAERMCIAFPHATTVNARSMQEYFRTRYRTDTVFIPNGVRVPDKLPAPKEIRKWGLEKSNFVLFVARLEPEKGAHTLIEAFRKIMAEKFESPVRLVIAGPRGYSKRYVAELERNSGEQISFLGFVGGRALEELYANALAFVLPSLVEGMSNSLLMAMAYAAPVVVSDIPENLAVIEQAPHSSRLAGKPGLSFRAGDADDLASKLQLLIADPETAGERGRLLQRYVRKCFSVEAMGSMTRELYISLLQTR